MLIDGLSIREEQVARAFQNGIGKIRLFGGSAGDDTKFERTWVFYDGAFHTDATTLLLINTGLPFRIFRTQHFGLRERTLGCHGGECRAAHRQRDKWLAGCG